MLLLYVMIYFIQEQESPYRIKIGYSKNAYKRIREISAGFSQHMTILKIMEGDRADESFFHQMFADCKIDGKREWFYPYGNLLDFLSTDKARSVYG